ncbi:exported hypothetical protein [Candidatus Sulfotelmatomonas gaucii]|uniref:Uncharacterized protein n=1 Tax=Candidatus Sulfuritelmatomonas gaucii TaxID=2043161 RepID=A0A2N9L3M2_9BACT|nr:exported hypothetical protein [Candidatus Sulfotelmatomonas gaucii]
MLIRFKAKTLATLGMAFAEPRTMIFPTLPVPSAHSRN